MKYLGKCRPPVNIAIVIAMAEGIITSMDANLLVCNGEGIPLTKNGQKVYYTTWIYVYGKAKSQY